MLLTWAGSLSSELNSYWLTAQPGSRGQPGGMLNSYWLHSQPSSFSFFLIFGILVAEKKLLKMASKWQAWGQEKLLGLGDEIQVARDQ